MLSYRHGFHAGNFADVLKHLVLMHILEHLKKKDKPFCYIDTHAGAGQYSLNSEYALKNREFDSGIGRLWQRRDLPEGIAKYVEWVRTNGSHNALLNYPGSPALAASMLRSSDRLFLFELHSTEFRVLHSLFQRDRRIKLFHSDGFKDAISLLPPHERRGLVFIDPSYELARDYYAVVESVMKMYKRFATGVFAIWYPVVERQRIRRMERALAAAGIDSMLLVELGVLPDQKGHGMTASGMIILNPPWTLEAELRQEMPWLTNLLAGEGKGSYRLVRLAEKNVPTTGEGL